MVTRVPGFVGNAADTVAKRWIGATAFVLFVLLCWLLARWTWVFVPNPRQTETPLAAIDAQATDTQSGERLIAAHLFGVPQADLPKQAAPQAVVPSSLNAKLKGVFAGVAPFPAFAIVNYEGKDQAVRLGDTLAPGVTLEQVAGDHVLFRRGTAIEKLEFDQRPLSGGQLAMGMPPRGAGAPPQLPGQAGQFKLNVQPINQNTSAISRSELNTALQDPRQLSNLGRVGRGPNGGVSVEGAPPGSLIEKLGLQEGDVVRSLNGVPVNSEADLMRLYQHFGQAGQVRVDGERGGQPLQLNYTIQK